MSTARQDMMAQLAEARRAHEAGQPEREYTPPIELDAMEIDTTPDYDGDLEVSNVLNGEHVAYLKPADQLTLRDLLNRLHPQEPQQDTKAGEVDEGVATGAMALAMAELARRCIGPDGTVFRVPAEDAAIVRSAFISRLAEGAMRNLDKDDE